MNKDFGYFSEDHVVRSAQPPAKHFGGERRRNEGFQEIKEVRGAGAERAGTRPQRGKHGNAPNEFRPMRKRAAEANGQEMKD